MSGTSDMDNMTDFPAPNDCETSISSKISSLAECLEESLAIDSGNVDDLDMSSVSSANI